MATGESAPPPAAPQEGAGGRKKMWVLVIVAVLVVAALAGVAVLLLSKPTPSPSGPTLDHVTISASGATTLYTSQNVVLTGAAFDTNQAGQTGNVTWFWSRSPAAGATLAGGGSANVVRVTAMAGGTVTVTATANLSGVSKSATQTITVSPLTFSLSASNTHPQVPFVTGVSPFVLTVKAMASPTTVFRNYSGIVHFTSSDSGAILPPDTTFSLADQGVKNFLNVSISKGGAQTVNATDTVYPITGTVTVTGNYAPVASFTITPNAADQRQITVDASGTTDADGDAITFVWNFGDTSSATGVTATHAYATAASYTIQLTATDVYGASNSLSKVYAAHSPPVAAFRVQSQKANGANDLLWANASVSTGGDGHITYYNWTWGDGNFSQVTTALAAHNYTPFFIGKTLTITLRVGSNYSMTNTTSRNVLLTLVAVPPVAKFTYSITVGPIVNRQVLRTLSVDGSSSSSPIGAALLFYNYTWGDGATSYTNTSNPKSSHVYRVDGSYVVTLTVIDSNGLKGVNVTTVSIVIPATAPVAVFTVSHLRLTASTDANGSYDNNNNIARYNFTWGDAANSHTNTTNPYASFTYAAAGIYTITLTVVDTTNLKSSTTQRVSVAASTLSYNFYDFFNVSYGEWWDIRNGKYGDLPINANCFNATSIADGACRIRNTAIAQTVSYPYTDWYPAPFGSLFFQQAGNDPLIYAPYRMDVLGANVQNYNLSEPVFIPNLYKSGPGNKLSFNWDMQYLDNAGSNALTAAGCPGVKVSFNDGFMIRSKVSLTMDPQEASRLFGLPTGTRTPGGITSWFGTQTTASCATSGALETAVSNWFANVGNGKYNIFNEYQYAYTPFYTNISAYADSALNVHVYIDMAAWGTEVLLARMFYWGNTSYTANLMDSTKARGWYGMELPWFEDFHMAGSITSGGMDFHLNTVMEYHFQAGASPGHDGTYHSSTNGDKDDAPYWTWGPWLGDYVAATKSQPYSELSRWTNVNYTHSTPGGFNYGQNLAYDYAPLAWPAKFGETWHFVWPAVLLFYDPNTSPIPSNPQGDITYWASSKTGVNYNMWRTNPNWPYGTYNNVLWTWDVAGNTTTTLPGWPTNSPGSYPTQPWGSIFLVPSDSKPTVGQPAVVAASSTPSFSQPAVLIPSAVPALVLSPVLAWIWTLIAAPALWGSAFFRE